MAMKKRVLYAVLVILLISLLVGCLPDMKGEKTLGKCTVTFDKNHNDETGYTEADPQIMEVICGETVEDLPAPPTREAYLFDHWLMETEVEFTEDTIVTADITVYAEWKMKQYTVCFDPNGGFPEYVWCLDSIYHGSAVPEPPAFPITKEGYELVGWNTKPDGSGEDYTADMTVKSNITFYAQWEREACGIGRFSVSNLDPDVLNGEQVFSFLLIGNFIVAEQIEIRISDGKSIRWKGFEVSHPGISIVETGVPVGDRLTNPTITLTADEMIQDGTTINVFSPLVDTSNGQGQFGDPVAGVTVEVVIERLDCETKEKTTFDVLQLYRPVDIDLGWF